jgi:hypothetical protein
MACPNDKPFAGLELEEERVGRRGVSDLDLACFTVHRRENVLNAHAGGTWTAAP